MEKGVIRKVENTSGDFLSKILLVKKKTTGNHPVINLKSENNFITHQYFKMESLHCSKYMLEENKFLCKIDLKDAYFLVSLNKQTRKYVRFICYGRLYKLLGLCFGLRPAPGIFTKLLKTSIAFFHLLLGCPTTNFRPILRWQPH